MQKKDITFNSKNKCLMINYKIFFIYKYRILYLFISQIVN